MSTQQLTEREVKALQIAAKSQIKRKGKVWTVPSQTGHGEYQVNVDPDFFNCTCPDHDFTQARCKHIYAVEYVIEREHTADGQTVVTETVKVSRKTYTQNWPAYMPLRRKRNRGYRHCSMNSAERFLSLNNIAEGRACRSQISSLPARSRFIPPFQADAFRVICRKQSDADFCQRCPRIIRCFVTWNPKLSRPTCTN
jgi:SWIM zinc finger